MAKTALIKVIIPQKSTIDDPSSNGFVFHGSGATDFTNIADVFTAVKAFYTTAGTGGTNPIAHYMAQSFDFGANACTIEAYDITAHLDGSPHGSPVAAQNWTFSVPGAPNSLPTGVAACVSFRADYGTDVEFGAGTRPRARDRNRVYVGPLNETCIENEPATLRARFTPAFITDCLAALFDLSKVIDETGDDWVLQVWSRRNAAVKLPTVGYMDNRPDYQRRRSDQGATKTNRALASV